jgi:hypothetical protein
MMFPLHLLQASEQEACGVRKVNVARSKLFDKTIAWSLVDGAGARDLNFALSLCVTACYFVILQVPMINHEKVCELCLPHRVWV